MSLIHEIKELPEPYWDDIKEGVGTVQVIDEAGEVAIEAVHELNDRIYLNTTQTSLEFTEQQWDRFFEALSKLYHQAD